MQDLPRHQGLRKKLLAQLIAKGIRNRRVLEAMAQVPRHLFMDSSFEQHAYEDKAFPIAAGQTISQPYTVAFQSEQLGLEAGQRVLEIGTGSGYQTAVLLEMGLKVYSIERQKELFDATRGILRSLGYHKAHLRFGDGYQGWSNHAPYQGILVTAGAPFVPPALTEQLAIGGRLVIPVGEKVQQMTIVEKDANGRLHQRQTGEFRFVPLLSDKNA